jgi:hypothetical protein
MFYKIPLHERPYDQFERDYLENKTSSFEDAIKQSEEKLAKLNHEKELLKLN